MKSFVYQAHPARVRFGRGEIARVAEEAKALGIERAFVIGEARMVGAITDALGDLVRGVETDIVMHVPIERAKAARARARDLGVDGIVSIGGGSSVGLAKAIALEIELPLLAIPTTFAGSEMTEVWGLTEDGVKKTGRDARVRPRSVIYDPDLVSTLPPKLAATSGMNAMAHAAEALYAPSLDPITALLAEESVRLFATSLPRADDDALMAAWFAGVCLDRSEMGLHHKLCHVLGGTFNLPHADVHAVILPYAIAFNAPAAPEPMKRLARALGAEDAALALRALAERIGAPTSLASIGMKEEDLDRAADLASENRYQNPRLATRDDIRALLGDARTGTMRRSP